MPNFTLTDLRNILTGPKNSHLSKTTEASDDESANKQMSTLNNPDVFAVGEQ